MVDYGTDVAALTDLPDPEVLISGPSVVAYAVTRRWLTQSGALSDLGDDAPYTSFDLRDYLGGRNAPGFTDTIQQLAVTSGMEDDRVQSLTVAVTFAGGTLTLRATLGLESGPFDFVLTVNDAGFASILFPSSG